MALGRLPSAADLCSQSTISRLENRPDVRTLLRMRAAAPRRSAWRTAQFDTLRLRLLKIAARIVEMKTKIKLHLPTACPVQPALALILTHTTRLVI